MTLDPRKWTTKTTEAITAAMTTATTNGNPELTVDHVLASIVGQTDTVVHPLLAKLGVSVAVVADKAATAVGKLSRAQGGGEPRMNRELAGVFTAANTVREELRDDYLSVEHLVLAMHDRIGISRDEMLAALRDVRGSHRVTRRRQDGDRRRTRPTNCVG